MPTATQHKTARIDRVTVAAFLHTPTAKIHGSKMPVGTAPTTLSVTDCVRKNPTGPARILVSPETLLAISQQRKRKAVAASMVTPNRLQSRVLDCCSTILT
jgi:hypothetical protein